MELFHIAVISSSEEKADRFYQSLLGFEKKDSKEIDADLAGKIFGIDHRLKIFYYQKESLTMEVFIKDDAIVNNPRVDHICLAVPDTRALLAKCAEMNFEVNIVPYQDRSVTFIKDDDGNQFEIKQQ